MSWYQYRKQFLTLFWKSGWAPAASNFSTILACPFLEAPIRAVHSYCGRRKVSQHNHFITCHQQWSRVSGKSAWWCHFLLQWLLWCHFLLQWYNFLLQWFIVICHFLLQWCNFLLWYVISYCNDIISYCDDVISYCNDIISYCKVTKNDIIVHSWCQVMLQYWSAFQSSNLIGLM